MNFKIYDVLSSLVPGYLLLVAILELFNIPFNKDLIIPYTAVAFLLGYLVNAISSWLEDFYFLTWNGKPSDRLLNGKDIWKVRFYHSQKVKELLKNEAKQEKPSNDELFSIAMRYANQKDSRVDDFNATYAFSRSILTTVILGSVFLLITYYNNFGIYLLILPCLFVVWLRCKQRGYYYAREVLNVYFKIKTQ